MDQNLSGMFFADGVRRYWYAQKSEDSLESRK